MYSSLQQPYKLTLCVLITQKNSEWSIINFIYLTSINKPSCTAHLEKKTLFSFIKKWDGIATLCRDIANFSIYL